MNHWRLAMAFLFGANVFAFACGGAIDPNAVDRGQGGIQGLPEDPIDATVSPSPSQSQSSQGPQPSQSSSGSPGPGSSADAGCASNDTDAMPDDPRCWCQTQSAAAPAYWGCTGGPEKMKRTFVILEERGDGGEGCSVLCRDEAPSNGTCAYDPETQAPPPECSCDETAMAGVAQAFCDGAWKLVPWKDRCYLQCQRKL